MLPFRSNGYKVLLPMFEGPLDLLLQLIERQKLDISSVSLAQVTDQFLDYVKQLERIVPDTLADFLVMAARLILIKSRLLLPRPESDTDEEEEDPAEALARQLREYKRFKQAALALRSIEEARHHAYIRLAPPPEMPRRLDTSDINIEDLLAAARAAFNSAPPAEEVPEGVVVPFTLTIRDQVALIRRVTSDNRPVTFRSLLRHTRSRMEIVVTLLALLELIKRRQIDVIQEATFGEIMIKRVDGAEITLGDTDEGINGAPRPPKS